MVRVRSCVRWFYYFYLLANIFSYKIIFFKSYSNYQISELNVKFDKLTWKVYTNCMKIVWKICMKIVWNFVRKLYENLYESCPKFRQKSYKIFIQFSLTFHTKFERLGSSPFPVKVFSYESIKKIIGILAMNFIWKWDFFRIWKV